MTNLYNTTNKNNSNYSKLTTADLLAKIADISIKNELTRRLEVKEKPLTITSPQTLADSVAHIADKDRENFALIMMDTRNQIINVEIMYTGTVNSITVSVREMVRMALLNDAVAVAVAHNHPSGDVSPSPEDIQTTKKIHTAFDTMDIQFLDHVIVASDGNHYSLRDNYLGNW